MCVGEEYSAFRQSVDIRRLYTRVAAEAADPVVHVVDRYEQNVRPLLLTIRKRRERAGDNFPSSDHRSQRWVPSTFWPETRADSRENCPRSRAPAAFDKRNFNPAPVPKCFPK